ncbi:MAG: glycosyltransferase [Oscillatoria princeps RMCB-10]|jgi:glycosyltransferase involved in cell wall biosynthesis|nr:glycosyltransferase [Oscillatoria princeps RMCB-10]
MPVKTPKHHLNLCEQSRQEINIYLWAPNLFEFKGGLQNFLSFIVKALWSMYPKINYKAFVKHDTGQLSEITDWPKSNFYFYASWPLWLRTSAFAAHLLGLGLWKRPNLIIVGHLNFTPVAYWLKKLTGIPYWTIVCGVDAWNVERPALQAGLQHADQILSISGYTRDRLLKEQNLEPAKISLLPCTFDASRFQIAPKPAYLLDRYHLKPEQPIILTVARLQGVERYKGYDQLLEAMPQIRQAIPNAHYIIVGKGNDRLRIERMIARLGLQDCVTLAGFVPDEQLCDYYNLCDVFAMPSKKEGFGIVYLEALACGKPTLGGNQDGAIDALCHGELGVLVDPDDVKALAQTLIEILHGKYPQPILYQPELLRQKVIDTYGFDRFKQTISQYLEEFLEAKKINNNNP